MDAFPNSNHLHDDVRRRTHNTIMFYDAEPVAVFYISGINVMVYTFQEAMSGRGGILIPYTDPKLVDRVPTLGYVNVTGARAAYVGRTSARSQRSGLPCECLHTHDGRYVDASMLYTEHFAKMLKNEYVTLQQAYDVVRSRAATSVAFSKTYAIDGSLNIFHRGRLLGRLVEHKYMPGYDIEYHSSVARHSFYERNFKQRFDVQLREFKPSE